MVILGAKGHSKEVLDILLEKYPEDKIVFFDNINKDDNLLYDKFKVFNNFPDIPKIHSSFFLGIGNIQLRKKLAQLGIKNNMNWSGIRSESACIGKFQSTIHSTVDIMQNVTISSCVKIEKGTLLNRNVNIHHDVSIGEFCEIAPNVIVLGGALIGDNVFIGAGAIILPKMIIEDNAIIGAGTVVNKDVKKSTKVVGNPCKEIGKC